MTHSIQRFEDVRYELVTDSSPEITPEPPLQLVRRTLRGRWPLALALALMLGAAGGIGGFFSIPPKYESTGLIQIQGALPAILFDSQENRVPPNFDSYVAAQISYLQSRDILEAAVNRTELRAAGWPEGDAGVTALRSGLTVRRPRHEPVIIVSMLNADPAGASAAVNAVLATFHETCADPAGLSTVLKEQKLVDRQAALNADLLQIQQQTLIASDQLGPEAIRRTHAAKVEEIAALEAKLAELRFAGASAGHDGAFDALAIHSPIATADQRDLAELDRREGRILAELAGLRERFGPDHGMIRNLTRQLEAIGLERDFRLGRLPGEIALAQDTSRNRDQIEARFVELLAAARTDAASLGEKLITLDGLADHAQQLRDRLAATNQRIDELRLETDRDNLNRFNIASWGETPLTPVSDRRQGLAAAGSLVGVIAGIGLVFLIGLCDPRVRHADALEALELPAPLLSVLPELAPRKRSHELQSERAVHQLRNLLELQCTDPNANVHAITSCDRGEGRTSLALALGSSFAAAGRKTLLIDADISRAELTRELGLSGVPGLCEAIGPSHGAAQVHPTREENLFALPVGGSQGMDPEDLSRNALIWLLEALRNQFDAIVIDSGPLLSSVEACLIAAVSDRTVLLIARNQKRQQIRSAVMNLHRIGARCAGVVFNRAQPQDLRNAEALQHRPASQLASLTRSRSKFATSSSSPIDDHHQPLARLGVHSTSNRTISRRAA